MRGNAEFHKEHKPVLVLDSGLVAFNKWPLGDAAVPAFFGIYYISCIMSGDVYFSVATIIALNYRMGLVVYFLW